MTAAVRSNSRNMTKLVGVRMTPAEYDSAQRAAADRGMTVPQFVRYLLAVAVKRGGAR